MDLAPKTVFETTSGVVSRNLGRFIGSNTVTLIYRPDIHGERIAAEDAAQSAEFERNLDSLVERINHT